MVERYAREEMSSKWTQQARYAAWLEVEKAAVKAWNKIGLIPDEDCKKIVKNATFSVERIEEIERCLFSNSTHQINVQLVITFLSTLKL